MSRPRRKRAPVTVSRIDPATGEIIEPPKVVPASSFKSARRNPLGTRLKDAPDGLDVLADELQISAKRMMRLKRKHGDDLLRILQREWWERQERPRLLSRSGRAGPEEKSPASLGYTDIPMLALGGPNDDPGEAVSKAEQDRVSAESHARYAEIRSEKTMASPIGRLRNVEALARKRGIDILPHLLRIEAELRSAEEELAA